MRLAPLSVALMLLAGSAAFADPVRLATSSTTVFESRSEWESAVRGTVSTITFEVDNQGNPFDTTGGFAHLGGCCPSFGNVMFHEESGDINIADTSAQPGFAAWQTGNVLSASMGQTLTITGFSTMALAFDWQLWNDGPFQIMLSNGASFTPTVLPFQPAFFGITSSVPITSLQLVHYGSVLNLDNVSVVAPVPEPATVTLLGLGLVATGMRRWRRPAPQG